MNDKVEGQGRVVLLPDGTRRIDFIRNNYYSKGVHTEGTDMSRSDIKNAINKQLEDAKREGEQIPYQIVFAGTKTVEDPRVAAEAAKKVREEAKAKRDQEKAEAKEAAKKAKEEAAAKKAADAAKIAAAAAKAAK